MEVNQLECCLADVGSSVVVALVDQENNKSSDHRRRMNEDGPIFPPARVTRLARNKRKVQGGKCKRLLVAGADDGPRLGREQERNPGRKATQNTILAQKRSINIETRRSSTLEKRVILVQGPC